jgi:hypothetical protein
MKAKIIIPSRVRAFEHDYRLPLVATGVFVAVLSTLLLLRMHEHSIVAQVLSGTKTSGRDYATLLSQDKVAGLNDNQLGTEEASTPASTQKSINSSSTTFTSSSGSTATSGNTSTAASGTASSSSSSSASSEVPATTPPTSGGGTTTPAQPFNASITSFRQEGSGVITCNGSGSSGNKCSKTYTFTAGIQTANGPGTVNYNWRFSTDGSSNGSFQAASGTFGTILQKQITLSCSNPTAFTAQLTLSSPTPAQSPVIAVTHVCN